MRWLAGRLDLRCAVSDDAEALASTYLGGTYEPVFNGIEVEPYAKATPTPTDGPTILFLGRHEDRKGLAVLLDAMRRSAATSGCGWPATGPRPSGCAAGSPVTRGSSGSAAITDDEKRSRLRGADIYCAPSLRGESFGVVLLEAMAADRRSWPATCPATAAWPGRTRTRCWCRPATRRRWPARSTRCSPTRPGPRSSWRRARQRVQGFSMDRLADRYVELYERVGRGPTLSRSASRPHAAP